MEVILIEKIEKLGNVGDQVVVKNGFARNYLIPQNKALRSTAENKEYFEKKKTEIIAKNEEIAGEAKKIFNKIDGKSIIVICHASDEGRLYGSILTKDIAEKVTDDLKVEIKKSQIILAGAIREVGIAEVKVRIHADYVATVKVNVARSQEEAQSNVKGSKKREEEAKLDQVAQSLGDVTQENIASSDSEDAVNSEFQDS